MDETYAVTVCVLVGEKDICHAVCSRQAQVPISHVLVI